MKAATDYKQPDNWLYISKPELPVDVFYLYPTSWQLRSSEHYICPVDHRGMRKGAETVFNVQASAFFPVGNVFAPFYRQADGAFMIDKAATERRSYLNEAPVADATAAFAYYIEHFNGGRPYILAAHSQGADVMKELLIEFMPKRPDVYTKMIAAYIPGCSITQAELDMSPHLKFAKKRRTEGGRIYAEV